MEVALVQNVVTIPSWLVVLLVSTILGLFTNTIVVAWWASRINYQVGSIDEEVAKLRPVVHGHTSQIGGLALDVERLNEDVSGVMERERK